jgi:hypothetical protein
MAQSASRTPVLSLIVPTRQRTAQLGRLLHSLATTAHDPARIEVVLVIDADDRESLVFRFDRLAVRRAVVPPGLTMGELNRSGYEASSGRYVMLLNDDVVARTRRWDRTVRTCLSRFPDGIVLVHTNDNLFGPQLCTFPIVSRTFCELAGGICPPHYARYRIDDHIEDVFNLLWALGEQRTIYLPDVVFEHFRYIQPADGEKQYILDEETLALDAVRFLDSFDERKDLALRLKQRLAGPVTAVQVRCWRDLLEGIEDPFSLRVPERLRVEHAPPSMRDWLERTLQRVRECVRQKGYRGLARAVWNRVGGPRWRKDNASGNGPFQPHGEQGREGQFRVLGVKRG